MADAPRTDPLSKRCENCGLLAQLYLSTHEYVPAEEGFRRNGEIEIEYTAERGLLGSRVVYAHEPRCAGNNRDFSDPRHERSADEWQRMLREDMSRCASFVAWVPGLSVKDHKEMLDRQYMMDREDRRDAEMRKREDDRDMRVAARDDAQDKLAQERHAEQMKQLRGQHWRELLVFGLLIGVATICAAILDGAVSTGWQPGWWPW